MVQRHYVAAAGMVSAVSGITAVEGRIYRKCLFGCNSTNGNCNSLFITGSWPRISASSSDSRTGKVAEPASHRTSTFITLTTYLSYRRHKNQLLVKMPTLSFKP